MRFVTADAAASSCATVAPVPLGVLNALQEPAGKLSLYCTEYCCPCFDPNCRVTPLPPGAALVIRRVLRESSGFVPARYSSRLERPSPAQSVDASLASFGLSP